MSQSTAGRLRELYADGGVSEVSRGVRDWAVVKSGVPFHWFARTTTLSAGDISVELRADSNEAVWRSIGHGESAVQRDFVERVDDSDTVWDVGANIGSYSLLAAAIGADVVAFEPGPRARAALVQNAQENDLAPQIDATPFALSDFDGDGVLLPARWMGTRELRREAAEGDTVPVRRGDNVSAAPPDVVKIDVEGAEVAVLEGLAERLELVETCYVEIHEAVDPGRVTELLTTAGLSPTDAWLASRPETIVRFDR